jgi:hypothetical protein
MNCMNVGSFGCMLIDMTISKITKAFDVNMKIRMEVNMKIHLNEFIIRMGLALMERIDVGLYDPRG